MKKLIKLIGSIFIILLSISCGTETYELLKDSPDKYLEINSSTAVLMQRVSMNDGSIDNIIDNANCFSVQLPITVNANSQQINVVSKNDLDYIEDIFDESNTDTDILKITFPMVLVLNDFSEVKVNSQEEFSNLVRSCNSENTFDDSITCIDFLYPISVSQFNKTKELTSRIRINNDKQLYFFIKGLNENLVISIDFPLTMAFMDEKEVALNDLLSLETTIRDVENLCDEDDLDSDEDDYSPNISKDEFLEILTACNLIIKEFKLEDIDLEDSYNQFDFKFNSDGSIVAGFNDKNSSGSWEISTDTNDNEHLNIIMDSLVDLNNNWSLDEIKVEEDKTIIELKFGEDELEFQRNCE